MRKAKPTHGDGNGRTSSLEPQPCATCGAALEVADVVPLVDESAVSVTEFQPYQQVIICPNGHEVTH